MQTEISGKCNSPFYVCFLSLFFLSLFLSLGSVYCFNFKIIYLFLPFQCDQFVIGCETSIKVTKDTIKLSDLESIFGLKGQTVHLQDAKPDELQLFIDKLSHFIKGKSLEYSFKDLYVWFWVLN